MRLFLQRASLFVVVIFISLFCAACQVTPNDTSVIVPTVMVDALDEPIKWSLIVRRDGPHWLSPDWFAAQGIPTDYIDIEYVSLHHGDTQVPIHFVEAPTGTGVLFLAETDTKRIGDVGGYVLVLGDTGAAIPEGPPANGEVCQETTLAHSVLEQNNEYRSTAPTDLPWFWQSLRAPQQMDVTLVLTDAMAQPADLTLTFWAQSRMPQEPDHQIRLAWNGDIIDDHKWDAGTATEDVLHSWQVTTPALDDGSVTLTIDSPGETEAPVEMTWLDRIEITWTRALHYQPDIWSTWDVEAGADVACFASQESSDGVVALLTGPDELVFFGSTGDGDTLTIPQTSFTRGWLGVPWLAPSPAITRLQEAVSDADLEQVDYIILAHQQWHSDLAPLIQRRSEEGLVVMTLTPNQVYDTWGDGTPDSAAITAMVRDLHARGALQYLLIVGDASADPQKLWQEPERYIPTAWVRTTYVGDTSSDVALVANDEDMPLIAVGRMLPDSIESLQLMIRKTLAWQPTSRLMIVNDNEAQFERMSAGLSEIFEPDATLNSGDEDARSALLAWLKEDSGTFIYTGHGSLPVLGDEKILTFEDAGGWPGPTVVVAWSCLCGTYAHPIHTGLGEAWLQGREGTVAFIGPTSETTTGEQNKMALELQAAMTSGARIGDALLRAWTESASRDARLSFVLLGDPALQPFPTQE